MNQRLALLRNSYLPQLTSEITCHITFKGGCILIGHLFCVNSPITTMALAMATDLDIRMVSDIHWRLCTSSMMWHDDN
jgi:hypothetical protein